MRILLDEFCVRLHPLQDDQKLQDGARRKEARQELQHDVKLITFGLIFKTPTTEITSLESLLVPIEIKPAGFQLFAFGLVSAGLLTNS